MRPIAQVIRRLSRVITYYWAVSDNGCGMDQETLGKIFEPFFTTKASGKGTGLDLATVYGVVKQNNGFIYVYSEAGHGTTFKIYLPRHWGKRAQALKEPPATPAVRGCETILLVEDESMNLDLVRAMLEKYGYQVLAALTPEKALRIVKEHVGEIHMLMTDVVMPEMNGPDLAKKLDPLCPGLKHLFMSGYTSDVVAHMGDLNEGFKFIQKPFSVPSLAAKIRKVLDGNKR